VEAAEVAAGGRTGVFVGADSHSVHYLFGPRFRFGNERITPFVQALFGGVTRSDIVNSATGIVLVPGQTSFGLATGGGIDFKLAHHWSVRAVQVEYVYTFAMLRAFNEQNGANRPAFGSLRGQQFRVLPPPAP
jgi:hypothetical protein